MDFGELYNYSTKNGVVIPDTSQIRTLVENAFKNTFGDDFIVEPETPQGRIIEAYTMMFVDVLRVCAINANSFNPAQAVGSYLDNISALFGNERLAGESDYNLRKRNTESIASGTGYAEAVRRALSQVQGVISICVLDNGDADPAVLPNSTNGISVGPHTVFICVAGGNDTDVANAIFQNISAGCAFEANPEYGTVTTKIVTDDNTGTSKTIKFYRPQPLSVSFEATVRDDVYTGDDIVGDTKNAIANFVNNHATNYTITQADIISAIGAAGSGLVCTNLIMKMGSSQVSHIAIRPFESVSVDASDDEQIIVNVV